MEIIAIPNEQKTAFAIPNEYQKARLLEWLKKYGSFKITPITEDSHKSRRYLHGAVEPSWAKWQYGIDPRQPGMGDVRHFLFMRDFNATIISNRDGDPERVPQSSRGMVREVLDTWSRYCEENGAPIPNPDLYKKWRDEWSMDLRFPTFHDWLEFLNIEEDAMPSAETFAVLSRRPEGS